MAEANFKNRTLYHGDNLEFLRGMNSGTVHLIATDPPFNKNRDFHATPDSLASGARFADRWSWEKDVHDEWVDSIKDDWPAVWRVIDAARVASGEDMAAFLCWLGVRLMEMHRILRDDGSIYMHIDHTAHAWVKAMMDGIFGNRNFRNEVVWSYRKMPNNAKMFQKNHDTILFYSKSNSYTFNRLREESAESSKRTYERASRVGYNANLKKQMVTVWDWGKYNKAVETGVLPKGLKPVRFVDNGTPMRSVWEMPILSPRSKERTGYPTQKPLALYERIVKASSNAGDIVLDPFSGCATTPIAAERLGRRWVGMDIWDGAYDTVLGRLESEGLAAPDSKMGGVHVFLIRILNSLSHLAISLTALILLYALTTTRLPRRVSNSEFNVQWNRGKRCRTARYSMCW